MEIRITEVLLYTLHTYNDTAINIHFFLLTHIHSHYTIICTYYVNSIAVTWLAKYIQMVVAFEQWPLLNWITSILLLMFSLR